MIRLIRACLKSGIMKDGVVQERVTGTPQGGPLSPLLANVLLDEVDRELERRGHCFVRYADDANDYVRSRRAGGRSLEAATLFIGNCWLRELALMLLRKWRPTPAAGGAAAGCS